MLIIPGVFPSWDKDVWGCSGLDVERFILPLGVIEEVLYRLHLNRITRY